MTIFELHIFLITIAPTWYGLMYAIGFILGYQIVKYNKKFSEFEIDSLLFYVFLGVVLGGRFWYVIFYNLPYFLSHPMEVFMPWKWGMSFHGGVIWVILAIVYFSSKYKKSLFLVGDEVTSILPIGLGAGRIGNFINGELIGFPGYSGPFAMVKNGVSHFPTPLLESTLEGLCLGLLLWYTYTHRKFSGQVSAVFLLWYGVFRLLAEFTRLPDAQIGYLFWTHWITLGMILTFPMILGGVWVWVLWKNSILKSWRAV